MSTAALAVASAFSILAQGASAATPTGSDLYAQVGDCLRGVATQYSAEPFDKIVDRGVERCGAMVPFPVAPVRRDGAGSVRPAAVEPDHTEALRRHISFRLRQIIRASSPQQGRAP